MNLATIKDAAAEELRLGLRGPIVPLICAGMTGYLAIVLSNAQYLQEMGAADIPRNAPHLIYLMTAGQGFWLVFAWAWLFSRVVGRDREANLDEVVLASPVHLPSLLLGRFLGVGVVASVLGLFSVLGFLLVGPMEAMAIVPAGSTGPFSWAALFHAWLLLCVPVAFGLGALYVIAALRTRSAAGPFSTAGVIILVWMISMVILRGGDIDPDLATLIDPTAYGEVESQSNDWTPAQKMRGRLALTPMLALNRALWGVVPIIAFGFVLARVHRESLVLGPSRRKSAEHDGERTHDQPTPGGPLPPAVESPVWGKTLLSEAGWHLRLTAHSWGIRLTVLLLLVMGIAGSVVHVLAHADGPMVPRPELICILLADFVYIVIVFVVAGFVGGMMRRDEHRGFDEIVGATAAPLWARLGGRALAAAVFVVSLAAIPLGSGYVVTAVAAPESFSILTPLLYDFLVFAPALLELGGVTIVVHAWIQRPGLAHAATMVVAFIFVLNQEIALVSYPPAQPGIPAPVGLSELVGWAPWLPMLTAMAVLKVSVFALAVALALLGWPRGITTGSAQRWGLAFRRLRGPAGVACAVTTAAIAGISVTLHRQLVDSGRYVTSAVQLVDDARWEQRWASVASRFAVAGGRLDVSVRPESRTVLSQWRLTSVQASPPVLLAELPEGVEVTEARVDGVPVQTESSWGVVAVPLGPCAPTGCEVHLTVVAIWRGWPAGDKTPWIDPSGAWLRAEDVLPRLGLDPDRTIRAPIERAEQGLSPTHVDLAPDASVSEFGVAPGGSWSLSITTPDGWSVMPRSAGGGPLDFAVAWRPTAPGQTRHADRVVWNGPSHVGTATEILEDVEQMRTCLAQSVGLDADVAFVVQAPRYAGTSLAAGVLWLPEDRGWDVTTEGYGRLSRRFELAKTMAASAMVRHSRLRRQPGSRWIVDGLAGSYAMRCVRRTDGDEAWKALLARRADSIVRSLGALQAPIRGMAEDGAAAWVAEYAPAAVEGWTHQMGFDAADAHAQSVLNAVRSGVHVPDALAGSVGGERAEELMGPPLASDVSVASTTPGAEGTAGGKRWTWAEGGWQPAGAASRVVVRRGEITRAVHSPAVLDRATDTVVLDDSPSFERSIEDNLWPVSESR